MLEMLALETFNCGQLISATYATVKIAFKFISLTCSSHIWFLYIYINLSST